MAETYIDDGRPLWQLLATGRPRRTTSGGLVYHVLNRAKAGMPIFNTPSDYGPDNGS